MKTITCTSLIFITVIFTVNASAQQRIAAEDLPATGDLFFEGEEIVLPLSQSGSHPMLNVDLGDGETYQFIVDTGASVNVIDTQIAERLAFTVKGEMEIGAPGGNQIPGNIVQVPEFRFEKGSVKNAEFVTMDISGFSGGMTQGVIGLALFRSHVLTYDLSGREIRVSRKPLSADDPDVLKYRNVNGKIQLDLDVAGTTVVSHLDTGSMGGIMLPEELMDELPLKSPPQEGPPARMVGGERKTWGAQLDGSIRLADKTFTDLHVTFLSPSTGYGNIGGSIYGQYVMSIDQGQALIALREPTRTVIQQAPAERRVLGLMFRGMGHNPDLSVTSVTPGSLAENAGFEPGDKLISINGTPASEFSMPELGDLFGGSEPLEIKVDRDQEAIVLEIP